jgi:hypothetical protein
MRVSIIAGIFSLGCIFIFAGLLIYIHNEIGLFPFPFPIIEDTISIFIIGTALVALAGIFVLPIEKK